MKHYLSRLENQVKQNWNRPSLCDYGGSSMTYGVMAIEIEKLHILFSLYNINKGDKIAICARNRANWGVAFLAANTYGAVVVPILADFHKDSITGILNHSESVLLIADSDIYRKLDVAAVPAVKRVLDIMDFKPLKQAENDGEMAKLVDERFNRLYPDGFTADHVKYPTDNDRDLAVINYTSGSTGQPKGVMVRYECFSANIEFSHNRIPSNPDDSILSILPMAHMFGMVIELLYPLCGGSQVHYLGKAPSPTLLMKAMAKVRPFLVIAVPMVFEKIYKAKILPELRKPKVRLLTAIPGIRNLVYRKIRQSIDQSFGGNVRMYIMGGAAVNPEVEAFLKKIKFHFTVGYGMTEAAPLLAYEDWDKFSLRSCGKAIDCVTLRVNSENPETVAGEIQARGVNICSGYYKNEAATNTAFTPDGWFNTGDLGVIDAAGNVYIKGRSKTMLLSSNGQNIYPEEIESLVNSQDLVTESVVVMRQDRLVALLQLDSDAVAGLGLDAAALEQHVEKIRENVNRKLSKYSQIIKMEVMTEPFEKTPKMSIKRYLYK